MFLVGNDVVSYVSTKLQSHQMLSLAELFFFGFQNKKKDVVQKHVLLVVCWWEIHATIVLSFVFFFCGIQARMLFTSYAERV